MLQSKNIIRSKGPIYNTYSYFDTEYCSKESYIINLIKNINTNTNTNNVLFIRCGSNKNIKDLDFFSKNINKLEKPIILITSDGDRDVPSSYNKSVINNILESNKIKIWYTQNYDRSIIHPKLSYLPIGFDLHTPRWFINNNFTDKIKYMISCRINSPVNKRIDNKVFSDTYNSISHNERRILYNKIKDNKNIDFNPKYKSFIEITKDYNKYNFAISPRGRGLDCHRTWELFLAGVIVITKTSSLDNMYIENNLPVIILKEWDELNNNLPSKLKKWYKNNINKTSFLNILPKLTFEYWIK